MFENQLVAITGGSSGLGLALARMLHQRGARLALLARDPEKLEQAKNRLQETNPDGPSIEVFACDVSRQGQAKAAVEKVMESMGVPDFFFNNAGILKEGPFLSQDAQPFEQVMGINFFGVLYCTRAVLPPMLKRDSGRIINISSLAGQMGVYGYSAYCSSKHALAGLTKTLRVELEQTNVRIQIAYPPEFESPMVDELNTYRSPENKAMVNTIPVMKLDDVATAIIRGVEKGSFEIIPGAASRATAAANQWLPGLLFALARRAVKKASKGRG